MGTQKYFRGRAFVSLFTGFSFVMVVLSGIALYLSPQGRIANWSNWTFWRLTKHQWGNLHICFTVVFLVVSVLHIWLNRKPLLHYFAGKIQAGRQLRLEWVVALLLCAIVFWGSLNPFIPFSSLLNLNEQIKFSWPAPEDQPPVPHMELLTVEKVAEESDVNIEVFLENLRSQNIEASPSDVFGQIAEKVNLSPNELYQLALKKTETDNEAQAGGQQSRGEKGGGFGKKTLSQVCEEMDLSPQEAIDILKAAGITASADETIRTIADNNNIHPSQIRQLLETQ